MFFIVYFAPIKFISNFLYHFASRELWELKVISLKQLRVIYLTRLIAEKGIDHLFVFFKILIVLLWFQTLETLEKKEQLLQKKISNEVQKAKDYTNQKNKNGMLKVFLRGFLVLVLLFVKYCQHNAYTQRRHRSDLICLMYFSAIYFLFIQLQFSAWRKRNYMRCKSSGLQIYNCDFMIRYFWNLLSKSISYSWSIILLLKMHICCRC